MAKRVTYSHKTENANLSITRDSAESAEKLMPSLIKNRDDWSMERIMETDIIKIIFGRRRKNV